MKGKTFHLKIQGYSKKGAAKALLEKDNKVCSFEVKAAALGEEIEAYCFSKKKKAYIAELVDILKPSPFRVVPKCSHANVCGGCSWQHLSYAHQLEQKQETVAHLFSELFDKSIYPIVAADKHFQYRNKMEFSFSQDKEGRRYLGLIKANSKGRVINLEHCYLVGTWQSKLLKKIRRYWEETELKAYRPHKDEGTFQTLILREGLNTGSKLVMLTVSGHPHYGMTRSQIKLFKDTVLEELDETNTSIYLRVRQAVKGQKTQFFEMHLHGPEQMKEKLVLESENRKNELNFLVSPSSFFQPNTHQAEKLFSRALDMVEKKPDMKILDLYCGTGTLSLVFANLAKNIIAVELNPYSVFDAIENAKINGISHIDFIQGDALVVLQDLREKQRLENIDLVVLDPPRAGLGTEALKKVIGVEAQQILYISCHPQSQKEDVEKLIESGYEIISIQPVDQFPHTPHIENIVVLKRVKN